MSFSVFIEETTKVRVPNTMLERAMRQFWEVKDQDDPERKGRSLTDHRAIALWKGEGTRIACHHHIPIPFREDEPSMPDNLSRALWRLAGLRARWSRNKGLKDM